MVASDESRVDDGEYIFTKTIRLKDGRVLVAEHYGLKAFRIKIRRREAAERD